jgi:hypothetical protein
MTIQEWLAKYRIPAEALLELAPEPLPAPPGRSEAYAQSEVRLEAAAVGARLWRNNVGVLLDARGVPVRFGLANDSKALNERVKSADLIGIRPLHITPAHVGTTIGQFMSREMKAPGWKYRPNDPHEQAQMAWALLIRSFGGDAQFATGRGTIDTRVSSGDTGR